MHLSQLTDGGVVVRHGDVARLVPGAGTILGLAQAAIAAGTGLAGEVARHGEGAPVDLAGLLAAGRLDCPLRHPDPAHMHITGTGLTHTGSANTRDAMHADAAGQTVQNLTDSMKMFRMGLQGGRPAPGQTGVQPEWFYKGTGHGAIGPRRAALFARLCARWW